MLFEDDAAWLIENLHNHGAPDGTIVERNDQVFFSGVCSVAVTEFQKFNMQMPGWQFKIAENPGPGEYRYLRFAWKRTEAPGIMLQLHARSGAWHRYYAGTLTKQTQSWGAMTRVADEAPRQWELVTRDLFKDFGPMTLTGIGLSALEGPGLAYFDHVYLGRTVEDLDRVTAARKGVADVPAMATGADDYRWLWRALAIAAIAAALACCLFALVRRAKKGRPAIQAAAAADGADNAHPGGGMIGFACSACGKHLKIKESLAGKRVKCPGCGQAVAAPAAKTP